MPDAVEHGGCVDDESGIVYSLELTGGFPSGVRP
jgi:hypothetical protein